MLMRVKCPLYTFQIEKNFMSRSLIEMKEQFKHDIANACTIDSMSFLDDIDYAVSRIAQAVTHTATREQREAALSFRWNEPGVARVD
jgi:hypothetical protein